MSAIFPSNSNPNIPLYMVISLGALWFVVGICVYVLVISALFRLIGVCCWKEESVPSRGRQHRVHEGAGAIMRAAEALEMENVA